VTPHVAQEQPAALGGFSASWPPLHAIGLRQINQCRPRIEKVFLAGSNSGAGLRQFSPNIKIHRTGAGWDFIYLASRPALNLERLTRAEETYRQKPEAWLQCDHCWRGNDCEGDWFKDWKNSRAYALRSSLEEALSNEVEIPPAPGVLTITAIAKSTGWLG